MVGGLFTESASAQVTFNDTQNQASFIASLNSSPAHYLETFNGGGTLDPQPNSVPFSGPTGLDHFGYNVSTTDGGLYRSGVIFGTITDQRSLTITPTTGNINAVGGNFFVTNEFDQFQSGFALTITVTNAANDVILPQVFTPTSASSYFSIYSPNSSITSIVISAPVGLDRYNSIDNIAVGVSPVPEPSLILAGVAGLALVVGRVRRRFEPVLAV